MSDSVRPHRRQPTRLPRPWDSPGKNTGVGCHFLLQCMKVKSEREVPQSCPTLSNSMDCSLPGSSVHRIFQATLRHQQFIKVKFFLRSCTLPRTTSPLFCHMCANSHILSLFTSPRLSADFRLFFCCYQDDGNALSRFLLPGWKQNSYQAEAYLILFHVNMNSRLLIAMASLWVLFLDEFTKKGNRTELLRLAFGVCDSTNSDRKEYV